MIKNIFLATFIALSLLGTHVAIASETSQEIGTIQTTEGLDAMVNQALEMFHVPGVAVGLIVDGKVVLAKGYGLRDQNNGLPVTENTLFAVGSCTKGFTTHVLGQLVDEGKISWDDPVVKYLPEFRLKDAYATYHITIRDLLTHQSGLPRHDLLWYKSDLTRNELLHRLQYLDASTDLRGEFQYNNLMYVVAALVIERITGQTWEEAVQSRIFAPLGMDRSNFSVLDSQKSDDFSLPYREKNGAVQSIPFNNITVAGPAGSINSSVTDMLKWIGLQLSDGTLEGHQFVKKETLQTMHTPQVSLRRFSDEVSSFLSYGLGWFTVTHEGRYYVCHDGGIDGFISSTGFLPKEKIGVVVLTNSDSGMLFAESLARAIVDQALGVSKDDWMLKAKEKNDKMKSALQESQTEKDPSTTAGTAPPLSEYMGAFDHPGYGTIQVLKGGDGLVLSYHTLSIPLSHRCYDHFTGAWQDSSAQKFNCTFVRDHFGEITELHMPMESAVGMTLFKRNK